MMGHRHLFLRTISLCSLLIAEAALAADGFMVRVTANPGQIKTGSEVLATVPQGTRLWVFEVRDDRWVKVKVPGEETKGWLHSSQIQRIERSDADYARLSGASAHFKQYEQLKLERQLPQAIAELRQCLEIERQVLGEIIRMEAIHCISSVTGCSNGVYSMKGVQLWSELGHQTRHAGHGGY
ncbi:MAG: SH3 domain-containing protein [Planctomycetaceae bacterium]